MKVRWTTESLRFRITPRELEQLRAGEGIGVLLRVPGGKWEASIVPATDEAPTELGATGEGTIRLHLAKDDLARLCQPEREGVYFRTDADALPVRYFIEKDFPCVHPRPEEVAEAEGEGETFAPPPGFAERHRSVC